VSRIYLTPNEAAVIALALVGVAKAVRAFDKAVYRETGIEVFASGNKPLAPGKPTGSRAKSQPAKGRKPPRKVADKG
jgi:hypothetical protein